MFLVCKIGERLEEDLFLEGAEKEFMTMSFLSKCSKKGNVSGP